MKWALNGNNAQRQSRQCARPPLGWGRTHRGDVVASPGRREAVHAHDDFAVPVPAAADLLHDQRARRGLRVCRASRRWCMAVSHPAHPYERAIQSSARSTNGSCGGRVRDPVGSKTWGNGVLQVHDEAVRSKGPCLHAGRAAVRI